MARVCFFADLVHSLIRRQHLDRTSVANGLPLPVSLVVLWRRVRLAPTVFPLEVSDVKTGPSRVPAFLLGRQRLWWRVLCVHENRSSMAIATTTATTTTVSSPRGFALGFERTALRPEHAVHLAPLVSVFAFAQVPSGHARGCRWRVPGALGARLLLLTAARACSVVVVGPPSLWQLRVRGVVVVVVPAPPGRSGEEAHHHHHRD